MTIPPERKRIVVNANVYPEGFFVNSNNKIYITKISPFYRLREIKNRPKTINWTLWCGLRDSNSRPLPWQGSALTTELNPQVVYLYYSTDATACK